MVLLILQMNYRKKEGCISDGLLLMKEFILPSNHLPFVCEEEGMHFYCYSCSPWRLRQRGLYCSPL